MVDKLLLASWLLSRHKNEQEMENDLWYLLNPSLADAVHRDLVSTLIDDLIYLAITFNLKLVLI